MIDATTSCDRRCVWMVAGVVRWKVCDRDFACEQCPLDRALRPASFDQPVTDGRACVFPDDRHYHPNHTWLQEADDGRVRVGLDCFAARLLGPSRSCVFLPIGTRLERGRPGVWLMPGEEPFGMTMPVSGRQARINMELTINPWLATVDPYDAGWLVECEPEQAEAFAGLLPATEIAVVADDHLQWIRHEATAVTRPPTVDVGPTAQDGGLPLPDLRDTLTGRRWAALVRAVLSPHQEVER